MKKIYTLLTLVIVLNLHLAAASVSIVPEPQKLKQTEESFTLSEKTVIQAQPTMKVNAELLQQYIKKYTGIIVRNGKTSSNIIKLQIDKELNNLGAEGYKLTVNHETVQISAYTNAGIFYGIQTFLQLIPINKKAPIQVPGVIIEDKPVFHYRGMMLDTARHYYSTEFIKKFLDIMAMHKLNKFHWHFIDDTGWRPEIIKYPELTKKGAFRIENGKKIGGYYSQNQMRDIVQYATDRQIVIIPEIELPAHTLSAIVAYPFLSCENKQLNLPNKQFISHDLYCPSKETTWTFLNDVFKEISAIFPGKYVHIGGDEAKYDKWKKCPACQELIKKEGLKDEKALQGWMTKKVEKILAGCNKTILGWDEILRCGVNKNTAIMVWYRPKAAKIGAEKGHNVIMALTTNCYFDTPESQLPDEPPAATWIPPISLKKAYTWDPMPPGISPEASNKILGPEACIWSDQVLKNKSLQPQTISENYVQYLLLPRAAALAEVAWTPKNQRNWDNFKKRMAVIYTIYSKLNYHFRVPLPEVKTKKISDKTTEFTLTSPITGGSIHYEVGGEKPTSASPVLDKAIKLKNNITLKAITVTPDGKQHSLIFNSRADIEKYDKLGGTFVGKWKTGGKKKKLEFSLTGKINNNGKYSIIFIQTTGNKRKKTKIKDIAIYRNNEYKIIQIPEKLTISRSNKVGKSITFTLNKYETGASFEMKCEFFNPKPAGGIILIKKIDN